MRRLLTRLPARPAPAPDGATVLLALAIALFSAITVAGAHGTVLGDIQAGAGSAVVGGGVSWLTTRTLRPADPLAAALGDYLRSADAIRSARVVPRLAAWLSDQGNAGRMADLLRQASRPLREKDTLEGIPVAPLAGRLLRAVLAGDRHVELCRTAVSAADRYLAGHRQELRARFERESASWLPGPVYRLLFDRLYAGLHQRLATMAANPADPARRRLEEWLLALPDRLETSPELRERGERLKREVLSDARVQDWLASGRPASPQLAEALTAVGRRLAADRERQASLERLLGQFASALADQFRDELADLVTRPSAPLPADQAKPEARLRCVATLAGAGAGLILHAIAVALMQR